MGGRACNGRRHSPVEIATAKQEVAMYLDDLSYKFVKELKDKDSFGDLDILVSDVEEAIERIPHSLRVGNSVLFGDLQIDLLKWDNLSDLFYNYNVLGALIGKLAYHRNYKLNTTGLYLVDIPVATTVEDALAVLGLSYDRWLLGFSSDEILSYLQSSPLFEEEITGLTGKELGYALKSFNVSTEEILETDVLAKFIEHVRVLK